MPRLCTVCSNPQPTQGLGGGVGRFWRGVRWADQFVEQGYRVTLLKWDTTKRATDDMQGYPVCLARGAAGPPESLRLLPLHPRRGRLRASPRLLGDVAQTGASRFSPPYRSSSPVALSPLPWADLLLQRMSCDYLA